LELGKIRQRRRCKEKPEAERNRIWGRYQNHTA